MKMNAFMVEASMNQGAMNRISTSNMKRWRAIVEAAGRADLVERINHQPSFRGDNGRALAARKRARSSRKSAGMI